MITTNCELASAIRAHADSLIGNGAAEIRSMLNEAASRLTAGSDRYLAAVWTFMRAADHIPDSSKTIALYDQLCEEEAGERDDAMAAIDSAAYRGDRADEIQARLALADAAADEAWTALGLLIAVAGPVGAQRVLDEVIRSNLAKIGPDGRVEKRVDGKILKPAGWEPPDIAGAVLGMEP